MKFDAVSGDYYPIVYFNDYWNLQKDYYPINETLKTLPLRLSYCPLSLWRWQLYAAQNARSPWNFLPEDTYEQSDEDQDSVKVLKEFKAFKGREMTDISCFWFLVCFFPLLWLVLELFNTEWCWTIVISHSKYLDKLVCRQYSWRLVIAAAKYILWLQVSKYILSKLIFFFVEQVALLETNPYLLGLTIVVSIVHSIFEFLAFKNGEFT